ncbi:WxL domain-containing protein [Vagococcus elongatus]|uniref:WxL domain-containing protein n=1 Tax=Vagococcus elongatus TaxID=180344 RepID=A0A430ANU7_9ENTE|nr:WxL domain-containing protein [Vagococcus elongatus]RSU09584.1 hypothetical protein CBF29_11305 [Vagococcus elongatus]
MKKFVLVTISTLVLSSLVLAQPAKAATSSKTTDGKIEYVDGGLIIDPDPDPEIPPVVDPDPDPEDNFEARLPEMLDFGKTKVHSGDKTFLALINNGDAIELKDREANKDKLKKGAVAVLDNTGEQKGWEVKVKQNTQFAAGADVLEGAVLSFTAGRTATQATGTLPSTITPEGTNVAFPLGTDGTGTELSLMKAEEGEGVGLTSFAIRDFQLTVPGSVMKVNTYTTTLDWTVSNTP